MSKAGFWLPRSGQTPPIIRIKGVEEHSIEARLLQDRYSGLIRQFYRGAAQNHYAGNIDQTRSRRAFPDVRMTYTNMFGQEILDLEFAPRVLEQAKFPSRPPELWPNWAVVNFRVPASIELYGISMRAETKGLDGVDYTTERGAGGGYSGPLYTPGFSPLERVPTLFTDQYHSDYLGDGSLGPLKSTFDMSLRIDLRPWVRAEVPVMSVDVYGVIIHETYTLDGWHNTVAGSRGYVDYPPNPPYPPDMVWNYPHQRRRYSYNGSVFGSYTTGYGSASVDNLADAQVVYAYSDPYAFSTPWTAMDGFTYDTTSGLLTAYDLYQCYRGDWQLPPDTHDISPEAGGAPPGVDTAGQYAVVRLHVEYDIVEDWGLHRPYSADGSVVAAVVYGDPTWGHYDTDVNWLNPPDYTPTGFRDTERVWSPSKLAYGDFKMSQIASPNWPVLSDDTFFTGAARPGDPGTKLGTITVVLPEGTVGFSLA